VSSLCWSWRSASRVWNDATRIRDKGCSWLSGRVLVAFADRIIPIDLAVAQRAAALHTPDPRPERDALIAATATVHGLRIVTRNVNDFAPMGVDVVDPWS